MSEWNFLFKNLSFFLEQPEISIAAKKDKKIYVKKFFNLLNNITLKQNNNNDIVQKQK